MSEIIELMQSRFPRIYDVYNKKSVLYSLLSVYADRIGKRTKIADRLYAMIGIDSTYDEDLEHRWGSMLGIYKMSGESYNDYRRRLLVVYSSLSGGTEEAIKYAIASAIGISNDANAINEYINVYDAWLYDGDIPDGEEIDTSYGNIICTVDLSMIGMVEDVKNKILESIYKVKASGINPHVIMKYIINESYGIVGDDDFEDIVITDCSHMVLSAYPHETLSFFTNEEKLKLLTIEDYLVDATFDNVGKYTWDEIDNHTWDVTNEFGVREKE